MSISTTSILIILLIPFFGTCLGSAMVFFLKNEMNNKLQRALLGFAAGVMIAASFWSLLVPSIEYAEQTTTPAWIPCSIGFIVGILFLLLLDTVIPHLHINSNVPEGSKSKVGKSIMMMLAVGLHNIPEGMTVGVVLAGLIKDDVILTVAGAFTLSIGIAIQNFPEGAIVSMPLIQNGFKKSKAFGYGVITAIVEPLAALLTMFLTSLVLPILPYVLSFAAGAMIYVCVEELIPSAQQGEHSNIGTIGVAAGFVLMMVLEVALA